MTDATNILAEARTQIGRHLAAWTEIANLPDAELRLFLDQERARHAPEITFALAKLADVAVVLRAAGEQKHAA